MITLQELFKVFWTITEINITARSPDGLFLHEWIHGEDISVSTHMRYREQAGELTIKQEKINHHAEQTRGGAELGWGVNEKLFPKAILNAPIRHMTTYERSRNRGHYLNVDVEMQYMTAEILKETQQ